MSIKQQADSTYTVRYEVRFPGQTKRWSKHKKGIRTKAEAERTLKRFIAEAAVAKNGLNTANIPKWEDAYEACLDEVNKEFAATTLESFDTTIRKWCHPRFSGRLISEITTDEIRTLVKKEMSEKSTSQQKNLVKYLRKVFRFYLEKGWITNSPVPQIQFRHIGKLKAVLNREQFEKLLQLALETGHEWLPIWSLAVMTGLRNGELYALQWDQVDLKSRVITVSRNWDHKGGFRDYTKSKKDRKVEFPEKLIPLLEKLKTDDPTSPFVLPRASGWIEGRQAEILRAFLAGAGLPRIRFHDLRASWATFLLGQGVPPAKVMAMGGWADLKTVMHYLRLAGIDIKGGADPFDK